MSAFALGLLPAVSCLVYDSGDLRGARGQAGAGTSGAEGRGGVGAGLGGSEASSERDGAAGSVGLSGSGPGGATTEPESATAEGGAVSGAGPGAGGTGSNAGNDSVSDGGAAGDPGVSRTLIDDFEDRNTRIYDHQQRTGFWYTFAIGEYRTLVPPPETPFTMFEYASAAEAPPPLQSIAAFRLVVGGVTGSRDGIGAGAGFNFEQPKESYDASAYSGISFWIRANKTLNPIDLQIVTRSTDSDGQVCTKTVDCSNHFRRELQVGTTWQKEALEWESFSQDPSWGKLVDWNPAELYSVQFFVRAIDADDTDVELTIDDVEFLGPG